LIHFYKSVFSDKHKQFWLVACCMRASVFMALFMTPLDTEQWERDLLEIFTQLTISVLIMLIWNNLSEHEQTELLKWNFHELHELLLKYFVCTVKTEDFLRWKFNTHIAVSDINLQNASPGF